MTTYSGYGGKPYDSKAEAAASFKLAKLGCLRVNDPFPQTFTDADGTRFTARPDYFNDRCGLWLEFKAAPLNSKTTKATAERAETRARERKGWLTSWDWINCQWTHSKFKQAIVQRQLSPQNFIVVFDKPPTIAEARNYEKAGIVFVPLSALPSFLLHARLAKAGIKTGFELQYDVEEVGPIVLALG